jgi:DNA-binding transcriptional ArsR family regulator
VTEVAAPFEMSLNAVSKHIMVLEGAGLVRRRRVGREHFLSVEAQGLDEVAEWVESQRATWKRRLAAMDAALREQDRAAGSGPRAPVVGSKTRSQAQAKRRKDGRRR